MSGYCKDCGNQLCICDEMAIHKDFKKAIKQLPIRRRIYYHYHMVILHIKLWISERW